MPTLTTWRFLGEAMSQKILLVAIAFNCCMAGATFYEKKYLWTLYWIGAIAINTAVWFMKK